MRVDEKRAITLWLKNNDSIKLYSSPDSWTMDIIRHSDEGEESGITLQNDEILELSRQLASLVPTIPTPTTTAKKRTPKRASSKLGKVLAHEDLPLEIHG